MPTKIKDLPKLERPREKAWYYGIDSLSDIELLTLIIGSGAKGFSARDIAYQLLNDYGGLNGLSSLDLKQYQKYQGINKIKALELLAIFTIFKRLQFNKFSQAKTPLINQENLIEKYKALLCNEQQEVFVVISLNRHGQIVHEKILYKGSNNNVPFSYQDLFKELIRNDAKSYYIMHNHPNGKAEPSDEDVFLTSEIIKESIKMGFKLRDHIIIAGETFYSFKMQNFLLKAKS